MSVKVACDVLGARTPMGRGARYALSVVLGVAAVLDVIIVLLGFDPPSAQLQETFAQIGATLLIAYVVETSWIVQATKHLPRDDREERLGVTMGFGIAALVGIATSLLLAAHADAEIRTWVDDVGFGIAVGPLAMLGAIIAVQPLLTDEWTEDPSK